MPSGKASSYKYFVETFTRWRDQGQTSNVEEEALHVEHWTSKKKIYHEGNEEHEGKSIKSLKLKAEGQKKKI